MTDEHFEKRFSTHDVVTEYANQTPLLPQLEQSLPVPIDGVPAIIGFELPNGVLLTAPTHKEISIGRHSRPEDPQVTIDLQPYEGYRHGVSRYHAMVVVVKGVLTVRDLNSVNGTLLNGYRLSVVQRYPLAEGDVITVGHFPLTVRFDV